MQERRTYDRFRLSGQAAVVRTGNREIPDADLSGALPADSRLPSVRQLAIELSINPNTIQRAYMTLEQEGLIYPMKGKGISWQTHRRYRKNTKKIFAANFELVKEAVEVDLKKRNCSH